MRRRPHEDQCEHQRTFQRYAACRTGPADHRGEGSGRTTNHDVLRGRAFEPHRIDDGIEEDRERQKARGEQIGGQPEHHHRDARERQPKPKRFAPCHDARRHRALAGPAHHGVDVGVPPHVQRTRSACPERDEQDRGEAHDRVDMHRCDQQPHQRGEHHQRHDARLQKRDVVAKPRLARPGGGRMVKGFGVGHHHLPMGRGSGSPPLPLSRPQPRSPAWRATKAGRCRSWRPQAIWHRRLPTRP